MRMWRSASSCCARSATSSDGAILEHSTRRRAHRRVRTCSRHAGSARSSRGGRRPATPVTPLQLCRHTLRQLRRGHGHGPVRSKAESSGTSASRCGTRRSSGQSTPARISPARNTTAAAHSGLRTSRGRESSTTPNLGVASPPQAHGPRTDRRGTSTHSPTLSISHSGVLGRPVRGRRRRIVVTSCPGATGGDVL